MSEVYKIWATLNLKGDAESKMFALSSVIKRTNAQLLDLGKNLNKEFKSLSGFIDSSSGSMKGFNENISSASRRVGNLTTKTEKLTASLNAAEAAAVGAGGALGGVGGGGRRGPRGGHGLPVHLRAHHMGPLGFATSAGGMALGGIGFLGLKGFESQTSIQGFTAKMASRGMTPSQISAALQLSQTANIPGVSQIDMLKAIQDSIQATQSVPAGMAMAPELAKGAYAINAIYHKSMTDKQQQGMMRFAEQRGGSSRTAQIQGLNLAFKLSSLSAGTITGQQMASVMAQGGPLMHSMSETGMLKFEPVMQSMHPVSAAIAVRGLGNILFGGIGMTNKRAEILTKMGWIDKNSIIYDKTGRVKNLKDLAVKPSIANMMRTDPVEAAHQFALDAKRAGLSVEQADIQMGSRPGSFLMNAQKQYSKEKNIEKIAPALHGIDQLVQDANKTNAGQWKQLTSSFENLTTSLGKLSNPTVLVGMQALASTVNELTKGFTFLGNSKFLNSPANQVGPSIMEKAKRYGELWMSSFPGHSLTAPSSSSKNIHVSVDNYMDGQIMANHVANQMNRSANRGMTISSSAQYVPSYTGSPTNNNSVSGGF